MIKLALQLGRLPSEIGAMPHKDFMEILAYFNLSDDENLQADLAASAAGNARDAANQLKRKR